MTRSLRLAVAALAFAGTPSLAAAADYDFGAPTSTACNGNWGREGYGPQAGGLIWYNSYLLNVSSYFNCWSSQPPSSATGYPRGEQIAVITNTALQVQPIPGMPYQPFVLESLQVGMGWTNNGIFTLRGYLGTVASNTLVYEKTLENVDADGAMVDWKIGGGGINYFTLSVNYNLLGAPSWTPSAACLTASHPGTGGCEVPAWESDPYNSRLYQYQSDLYYKRPTDPTKPYQTAFVSGFAVGPVSTVPEPSTYALMGAGLLALGVVARRRQRQG